MKKKSNYKLNNRIFLIGHNGLVGRSLHSKLEEYGFNDIVTIERKNLNLLNQKSVDDYFKSNKFSQVYLVAAKVGGILSNIKFPANFLYENLMIQSNVINACNSNNINNLLFFGSSCIYPKNAKKPIKENSLMTGKLEQTNEFYAIAKIAGLKLCEALNKQFNRNYRCLMSTNVYGPNDNFKLKYNHVLPSLISRFHNAKICKEKSVEIWGDGKPLREFIYVDDLSEAAILLMNSKINLLKLNNSHNLIFNVGSGEEISIFELSKLIAKIVKFKGKLIFNKSLPKGVKRKLLDSSLIRQLGWKPQIKLEEGIKKTYKWYINNI